MSGLPAAIGEDDGRYLADPPTPARAPRCKWSMTSSSVAICPECM